MTSFQNLLKRVTVISEGKASPYKAVHPAFGDITSKMSSAGMSSAPLDTIKFIRETLYNLDIITAAELKEVKSAPGFSGKKQAILKLLKAKQVQINAMSEEISRKVSETLDDFISGVGTNRGREEKYAAAAISKEISKEMRQVKSGKEMDDALTDIISDERILIQASIVKILSTIETELDSPDFEGIDEMALEEVFKFAKKINTITQLKSFLRQLNATEGYELIATYLSSAVKPIIQGLEDSAMTEDEEDMGGEEEYEEMAAPEEEFVEEEPMVTESSSYTSMYMSQLVTEAKREAPTTEKYVTFREKYKPQTARQLEELRRYGL
jgi:hypothetical protein